MECDATLRTVGYSSLNWMDAVAAYLHVYYFHALPGRGAADSRVAMSCRCRGQKAIHRVNGSLTEVRNTDPGGEVEHLAPIRDGQVGAFASLHHRIERPAQPRCNILLAKLDRGRRRAGCHGSVLLSAGDDSRMPAYNAILRRRLIGSGLRVETANLC